jgi:hypothetical protein
VDLRDFIVTPFIIIGVYALAYYARRHLCDQINYKYFIPALTFKIVGALALGFVYQFYYVGGDTFNYHTYGSRIIWEVMVDDPIAGLDIIFSPGNNAQFFKHASQVAFYRDPSSFFVVRISALFDIITFSTYSGTAVLFAFVSFLGSWFLFRTFCDLFPHLAKGIAICTLFVPSVAFWGSGILKDTIVFACLGFATYLVKYLFIDRRFSIFGLLFLILALFVIFSVKKYVLLCFVPAALFWVYTGNLLKIKTKMLRILLLPLLLVVSVITCIYVIQKVAADDPKYALDKIAETSRVTAYDIGFWSGRNAGSGYTLGDLDGSFGAMVALLPEAVNVSLFRPYLWEVRNPLMLLSSIEAFAILIFTILIIIGRPLVTFRSLFNPHVLFCLVFSIVFAFAVGISTYNFGTLNRYKIPLIPFYLLALTIIADRKNSSRKLRELEVTE